MFLPYGRQHIDDSDIKAVTDVLRSDYLTTGPQVALFEDSLKSATGAQDIAACSNGTTALHLALLALGVGKGDAVIVPTITFLATANAARYVGADVVFADVDPKTGLMGRKEAEAALSRCGDLTPKVIMPVHIGGHLCDLKALRALCDERNLHLIADSCHALGGTYDGRPVGACHYEDMATFSFHPVKTIAVGEGGAVATRAPEHTNIIRSLRSHGMQPTPEDGVWSYEMTELGYNYRITDMQCALGVSQLKKLSAFVDRRAALAEIYNAEFAAHDNIRTPCQSPNSQSGWHLYSVGINFEKIGITRNDFMLRLKDKNIGTQVHYIPVHTQPYYKDLYGQIDLPGAKDYYDQTLSIPLFPSMRDEDAHYVADTIKEVLTS